MKITKLTLYSVQPRWLFLKIDTDEGISGWGEPVVEGHAHTVQAAVEELSSYLIGQDPLRVEDHWQVMYRAGFYRGGPVMMSAMAGVDQALWDIKGKYHGLPIYEMLGGACRDKLKVYCWIGGDRPDDILRQAQEKFAQGYRAGKMNATEELHYIDTYDKVDAVLGRVAAIRDALGNEMDIAVDFHGRVHKSMAKILAHELEPLRPMFIEEPVLPQNNEALREIAGHTAIPIATGERMFSRWDFKSLLSDGYVDIIQPDLSHAGGISECSKIAATTFTDAPDGILEIVIPANIIFIEEGTFADLKDVEWYETEPDNPVYVSRDGVLFSEQETCLFAFPAGRTGIYPIPENVVRLAKDAFSESRLFKVIGMKERGMEQTDLPDTLVVE